MFDFKGEVTKRGGEFKPFSHKGFMDQKPDMMTRGHCFGLTIVWLSRYVRDRKSAGGDTLSNLSFAKASKDPQAIMLIRQIQNMVNSHTMSLMMADEKSKSVRKERYGEIDAAFGEGHENIINQAMRSLGVHGITFRGVMDQKVDMTQPLLGAIGRLDSALYAIHLPTHEVGAVVDKRRGVFKFIDVNDGQAVWKGAGGSGEKPFLDFLKAFFESPDNRRDYALGKMQGVIGYTNAMLNGEG